MRRINEIWSPIHWMTIEGWPLGFLVEMIQAGSRRVEITLNLRFCWQFQVEFPREKLMYRYEILKPKKKKDCIDVRTIVASKGGC